MVDVKLYGLVANMTMEEYNAWLDYEQTLPAYTDLAALKARLEAFRIVGERGDLNDIADTIVDMNLLALQMRAEAKAYIAKICA